MEEKKAVVEFTQLTPEQQEDVLTELEDAEKRYGDLEAAMLEQEATLIENEDIALPEMEERWRTELAEARRTLRGKDLVEALRKLANARRSLTETRTSTVFGRRELLRGRRELDAASSRIDELRKKVRA